MINKLRYSRKDGWAIEYSWCDERGDNWPSVYLKTTPAQFMERLKKIKAQVKEDQKMLARFAAYLEKKAAMK